MMFVGLFQRQQSRRDVGLDPIVKQIWEQKIPADE